MKLLLNGESVCCPIGKKDTLGKVLSEVECQCVPENNIIANIWVDGEPLTAERLSVWKDRSIEEFSEARIIASTRNELAANGLKVLAQSLADSQTDREEIVEHITQGRTATAMNNLNGYLQVWDGAQKTLVEICRLLEIDLNLSDEATEEVGTETQMILEKIDRLSEQLQEIKTALEAGDLVLLGDILDYEFGDITEEWNDLLESLADRY